MSVNIPNGSSGYFYSQLFRGLPDSQHCVPSLTEGGDLGGRGGWMLNFVLMLTSAFHQNPFFFLFFLKELGLSATLHDLKIHDSFTVLRQPAIVRVLSTTSRLLNTDKRKELHCI